MHNDSICLNCAEPDPGPVLVVDDPPPHVFWDCKIDVWFYDTLTARGEVQMWTFDRAE